MRPKSVTIIWVVLFALFFCLTTFFLLNHNLIQYSSLPKSINIQVWDEAAKKLSNFNLPVEPKDTIEVHKTATNLPGGFVKYDILFHRNPIFLVWFILILVLITAAAGSFPVSIGQIILLKQKYDLKPEQIVCGVLYALFIVFIIFAVNYLMDGYYKQDEILTDFKILLKKGCILNVIISTSFFLIFPTIVLILLIGMASDNLMERKITETTFKKVTRSLSSLHNILQGSLQFLAGIIVLSVLTSSALRESITALIHIKDFNIFPKEFSYVYGFCFSLFLAILYIPVYYYIRIQYGYLQESIFKLEEENGIKDETWSNSIAPYIKFENSSLDNIKLALTVLAPLLSSFLPNYLDFLK